MLPWIAIRRMLLVRKKLFYCWKVQSSLSHRLLYLATNLRRVAVNPVEIFIAVVLSTQPAKYTPGCELNCECR